MMSQMPDADQYSPLPTTPVTAKISAILGICSVLLTILAFWLSTIWFQPHGLFADAASADIVRARYLSFWFFWLGFPICAIISGSYARRRATSLQGQQLTSIGLAFGYIMSLTIVAIMASGSTPFSFPSFQ